MPANSTEKRHGRSWRKSGFTSIFLVIILASMMSLILAVTAAGYVKASGSLAEELCFITGRSLLSEYDRGMADRYGLFALRASEEKLQELADFYISSHIEKSDMFVKLALMDVHADTEAYCALDQELFLEQINGMGKVYAAKNIISSADLSKLFDYLGELKLGDGMSLGDIKKALEAVEIEEEEPEEPFVYDPSGEEIPKSEGLPGTENLQAEKPPEPEKPKKEGPSDAERLEDFKRSLNKSTQTPDYDKEEGSGDQFVISAEKAAELPSGLLNFRKRNSILLSGGILDAAEGAFCNEYILALCSDMPDPREDSILKAETEYILFGKASDGENSAAFKRSLFALRMAADLASNLGDPEKLAAYESAAAALPFIPAPVAVAGFAAMDAGSEAKQDVAKICSGEDVPLPGLGGFGSYRDYLRIFLYMLPSDEKAARLMDVMQLNIKSEEGIPFEFRDHAYGFVLRADFSHGNIEQEHRYR